MINYIIAVIVSFITGAVIATLVYRKNRDTGDKIIQAVEDKINNTGV